MPHFLFILRKLGSIFSSPANAIVVPGGEIPTSLPHLPAFHSTPDPRAQGDSGIRPLPSECDCLNSSGMTGRGGRREQEKKEKENHKAPRGKYPSVGRMRLVSRK